MSTKNLDFIQHALAHVKQESFQILNIYINLHVIKLDTVQIAERTPLSAAIRTLVLGPLNT